jgi:hypothetical protein
MVGWKLGRYGQDPRGSTTLTAAGGAGTTSKYADGTALAVPSVSGHRQVGATECPGNTLFPFMDQIRARAAQVAAVTPVKPTPEPTRSFVRALYEDFLNRLAGDSEVDHWADLVFRGQLTRQEAARGFTSSVEWSRTLVRDLYLARLGREPDPAGWDNWSRLLASNPAAYASVDSGFLGSQEFYARAGGTNVGWLTQAYTGILGRAPEAGGSAVWLGALSSTDRSTVALSLLQSNESLDLRVGKAYQAFLGRSPDPSGMTTWPPIVAARGDIELAGSLAASEEYFSRAVDRFPYLA